MTPGQEGLSPVEKLDATHDVDFFACGKEPLDRFLKRFALANQKADSARTYESIGDVVELVELLCQAILSTPREGGKNGGKIQDTVGELLGATIRTRFEDESQCQCLRVCRSTRKGICFAVPVGQEKDTETVIPEIQQRPLFWPDGTRDARRLYCVDGLARFVHGNYGLGHHHGVMCGLVCADLRGEADRLSDYISEP